MENKKTGLKLYQVSTKISLTNLLLERRRKYEESSSTLARQQKILGTFGKQIISYATRIVLLPYFRI